MNDKIIFNCPNCGCELHVTTNEIARDGELDFSKFVAKNLKVVVPTVENIDHKKINLAKLSDEAQKRADEIRDMIYEDGYIKNTKGHRRFVTAQMFRMLNSNGGYTNALNKMPYRYQWEMIVGSYETDGNELNTLAHLQRSDYELFKERTRFFNKYTVISMLDDYVELLKTNNVDMSYMLDAINLAEYLKLEDDYTEIYKTVYGWYKNCYYSLPGRTKKCEDWVDAYKGSGAYYTMMNLIKYHGCALDMKDGTWYGIQAVNKLKEFTMDPTISIKGYKLLGMLKYMIKYNNFVPTWRR